MKTELTPGNTLDTQRIEQVSVLVLVTGTVLVFQWWSQPIFWVGVACLALGSAGTLFSQIMQQHPVVRIIERMTIIGMIVGILGMLQSWEIWFYENGFYLLLASTLTFIIVSHIGNSDTE